MRELFSREKWRYLFYTLTHPSDGFYWIRHGGRGSVAIAVLLAAVFGLCFSLNRLYASFVVNQVNPRTVNSLTELSGVMVMYLMLCAGNWSITCLMGGEGRFRDILTAVGYAVTPMIVTFTLGTLLSQVVAENEEAFYTIVMGAGVAWSVILLLVGVMQIHNFSLGKTLVTLFLTLLAVFIIIFLVLLVSNFVLQVVTFLRSIYTELILRA